MSPSSKSNDPTLSRGVAGGRTVKAAPAAPPRAAVSAHDPMTGPGRYLTRMVVFLVLVVLGCAVIFVPLAEAFMSNPVLNGVILGVLLIGILYNIRQVAMLWPEVRWIEAFRRGEAPAKTPRLVGPMASMLGARKGELKLSALSTRSLLDGIDTRLAESRDISRYMIGLLIFLGLLGTFWGLLQTVAAVGDVVASLSVGSGDVGAIFGDLKRGLQAPLSGMATAFSSSLFGLAGSLILGFLDLQAGQALNRFYNDLEDWLSGLTRLSSGAIGEGEQGVPAYIEALLENTADSLQDLQRTISRSEESRIATDQAVVSLTQKIGESNEQLTSEIRLLSKTIAQLTGRRS